MKSLDDYFSLPAYKRYIMLLLLIFLQFFLQYYFLFLTIIKEYQSTCRIYEETNAKYYSIRDQMAEIRKKISKGNVAKYQKENTMFLFMKFLKKSSLIIHDLETKKESPKTICLCLEGKFTAFIEVIKICHQFKIIIESFFVQPNPKGENILFYLTLKEAVCK